MCFSESESEWSTWRKWFDHEVREVISIRHPWPLIPNMDILKGNSSSKSWRRNLQISDFGSWKVADLQPFFEVFFQIIMDLSPWVRLGYVHDIYQNLSTSRALRGSFHWKRWYPEFVTGVVAREPEFELIQRFVLCYLQPFGGRYIYIYMYICISICIYICIYMYIYIYTYESTTQRCLNGSTVVFRVLFSKRSLPSSPKNLVMLPPWRPAIPEGNSFQIPDLLGLCYKSPLWILNVI